MRYRSLLAKKLNTFFPLSDREFACIDKLESSPISIGRGKEIVFEGQVAHRAYILLAGWACSFKLLPNGGRQIIGFPIPGDCIGLRNVLLPKSDHAFSTLTDCIVCSVEIPVMMRMFNGYPRLATAFLWLISRDEAMLVEHLVNIGRRSAIERTAYFFLELSERLRLVGLVTGNEFVCPVTQIALADALGLSPIHVNRILRQLRERKLLTFKASKVTVSDLRRLTALAGYPSPD